MSDWLEPQFLDHLLGVSSFSAPSALYLGLSTASGGGFGDDGTGTESSLARQAISFSAPSNTSISSSAAAAIEYPRITGSAETIYGWGVFDAATAGNLLYHGSFPASSISLSTGDSFTVPAGSVSIGVSGALQPYAFKAWSDHCLRNTSWTMPSVLYLALDRTGSSVGPASASFSTLGGSFDEPRWHDWSTGTVTHNSSGTADQQNARVRAGVINGSGETYGGYQRCRLVYNAASNGSASLDYSVTRDDGRWYNDQSRNSNWDSTNSRRQNTGKTELRKWTDRVEFPIAGNSYPVVGAASTPPYGSGVGYRTLDSWSVLTGSGVVTGSYSPSSGEHYGTITGWGIFDAETPQTGNLLMRGTFASNIDATAHKDVVRILASSYTVTAA
jgi:hypothetical protein